VIHCSQHLFSQIHRVCFHRFGSLSGWLDTSFFSLSPRSTPLQTAVSGGYIAANLSNANLTNANLSNANISFADFHQADLSRAHLYRAQLTGVNLIRAKLCNAHLSQARLINTNLRYADLHHADLSKTTLSYSDLRHANLSYADLHFAILDFNYLSGANLLGAKLGGTFLGNINLSVVKGLETIKHKYPSIIGINTIYRSNGNIPETFLKGAGVDDAFISYIRSLVGKPIKYYSCFISYSSKDVAFAKRLYMVVPKV
jgi:hypothetical protein